MTSNKITFNTMKKIVAVSALSLSTLGFATLSHALSPFEVTYQFSYGNKKMGDATRKLSKVGNQSPKIFEDWELEELDDDQITPIRD